MNRSNGIELLKFSIEYWKGIEKVWKIILKNVWEPCI